jgi:hypothetical protein
LPRFPLDDIAPPPATRGRLRLQLVVEASEPHVSAAPATYDLFDDDAQSVALTHVYVPVSVEPPRDLESQRRFDEFWRTQMPPVQEPPAVFRPLFPPQPLLQRKAVIAALLGAAAIAAVAVWVAIFALLASTMGSTDDEATSEVETTVPPVD